METSEKAAWSIFGAGMFGLIPVTALLLKFGFAPKEVILTYTTYMVVLVLLETFVPLILMGKEFRREMKEMWVPHCG